MKGKKLLAGIMSAAMVLCTMALPAFADETVSEAVAEVTGGNLNGQKFSSLYAALEAANDDMFGETNSNFKKSTDVTIKLLKDTTDSGLSIGRAFDKTGNKDEQGNSIANKYINNNVTLDLGNNTLTVTADKKATDYSGKEQAPIAVFNNAVIKNGTINANVADAKGSVIYFHNDSLSGSDKIIFDSVNLNVDKYTGAALYVTGGNLIFKNSTVDIKNSTGNGTNAFDVYSKLTFNNTKLTIDGDGKARGITNGTMQAENNTVIENNSNIDITNCKHGLNHTGYNISDSTITIKNCTGNAISLENNTTISNSTVTIENNNNGIELNGNSVNFNVTNNSNVSVKSSTEKDVTGSGNINIDATSKMNVQSSDVPLWTTDTDSGCYMDDETKYGMMRFMFNVTPTGEITASGIKYIKASDIAAVPTVAGAVEAKNNTGIFQGDVVRVDEGTTGTYYARAYVTTENGTFWSEPVGCSVNWNQFFTKYAGGAQ